MSNTATPPASACRSLLLHWPKCGLSLRPRARWLAIEHCPRCLARTRIPVRLLSSPLLADEPHSDASAPTVEQKPAATTTQQGLQC